MPAGKLPSHTECKNPPCPQELVFTSEFLQREWAKICHTIRVAMVPMPSVEYATAFALISCYQPALIAVGKGDECEETNEILELLTSQDLREGLRQFYADQPSERMNPVALEFRTRLSALCGEVL